MNKQELENWSGALSVVLSGFFQACQHDLEDQMLIIALATGDHGTPLRDAAQDAIAESTDTGEIVTLRYSDEAYGVLRGSCEDWRATPAFEDLHYYGGNLERPWHVVLKHEFREMSSLEGEPPFDQAPLSREAKLGAARETLQLAASTLRKLGTTGGHCPELVNAAAEVESIFDWLYLPKQGGQYE